MISYLVERMNAPINGEEGPPTAAAAAAQSAANTAKSTAPATILETPRRDTVASRNAPSGVTSLPVDESPRWKHDIEEQLVTVKELERQIG